ncbi:hypothetical protein WA026_001688 [Henosepilachna vigintioctopunctata]|uniref:DNA 3'-5' helicase n=1 Tax=Henosepilachna vigintioctopunctata TaxID=420089 RepID=A0AAW1UIZ1_9CUCU
MVYISPMKALCEERLIDWHKKFSSYGVTCISITGDSDYIDFQSLSNHNLIITTPEKWDSITRKWRDNKSFIQVVKLFMIDEIHLLNEENRGATLEVLVCRMKTIQSTVLNDLDEESVCLKQNIRFLAASATFPNIKDVGQWLCDAKYFSFENNTRPVKLNTIVLGYPYNKSSTPFKFDMTLNYKLPALILKYSNGKPTLIFCSTRKSVEMAVKHLTMTLTIPFNEIQKETLRTASSSIADSKLKEGLLHGIGYHHGGLLPEARAVIEQLFRGGILPVLVTTSTLATGVNLPAHLVIIKSTKFYDKGGFQDYTAIAMLQMLGRAGRPQFDSEATALILTTTADKDKFEHMTDGRKDIESNLHRHLTEHLNAEIVLGTITDLDVAMRWLSSTFLYIRARQNPRHYGIPLGLTSDKIDRKLLEICQIDLNKLVKAEMALLDEDINIQPTNLGELMAKYYMSFETIKLFKTLTGNEILQQILSTISKCQEFSDMRLRVDEKKCLNLLNKNRNKDSIRFPLNGKIKTIEMKINCTIQAVLGCLEIEDHSILSEAFRIMRLGERICRCLIEFWKDKTKCYSALVNTIVLWKCFRAQLWENSPHVAKQFPGIGLITSNLLVNGGKTSLVKIINTNPREIEMITKKKPPFGNKVIDIAKTIPRYDMQLEKINHGGQNTLKLVLILLNPECLQETHVVDANDIMSLVIGDNQNNILLYERYMHSHMLENNKVVRLISLNEDVEVIRSHFISENIVGIDVNETLTIKFTHAKIEQDKNANIKIPKVQKSKTQETPYKKLDDTYAKFVQTYIDSYMKCKKSNSKSTEIEFGKPNNINTTMREILHDAEKNIATNKTRKELCNIGNMVEVVAEEKENQGTKHNNIPVCNSKLEPQNSTRPSDDYYNLSSYDESDKIHQIKPSEEEISIRTSEKLCRVKSLTDEEIAEHVDVILSKDLKKHDDIAREDIAENSECFYDKQHTTKVQMDEGVVNLDLVKEFPSLCDKYGMKQLNENIEENAESSGHDNYPRCIDLSKSKRFSQQKGKLHSAESFEDALFNPNTDSLNGYRYKPTERLSHNNSGIDHSYLSQSKKRKSESLKDKFSDDMMKNLDKYIESNEKESPYAKSIKWRSPLVYSPPVKYSPKISTSFSFSIPMPKNNDFESSHDWSMSTTEDPNTSSKNLRTLSSGATPRRENVFPVEKPNIRSSKFLLADREYENDESSEKNDILNQTQNTITMQTPRKALQLHDVISSSFLEDIGLSKSPRVTTKLQNFSQKPKSKNDTEMSVGTYYHDLIAKDRQLQGNSTYQSQQASETRAPFYLNQNTTNCNGNIPKSDISIRKSEETGFNCSTNNVLFRNRMSNLPHPQNYYQPAQQNAVFCPPENMNPHYPREVLVSNMPQFYQIPQKFELHGRYSENVGTALPVDVNNSHAFPSSRNFDHTIYFNNSNGQNRYALEPIIRPDCGLPFPESGSFSRHKEISTQLPSNDLSHINPRLPQGRYHPQYHYKQTPLDMLDHTATSTLKNDFLNNSFRIPNDINITCGSSNQTHQLSNSKNFVDRSNQQEYEKENNPTSVYSWKNIGHENPQNTFKSRNHDGFFLNAHQSVSSNLRYADETFPAWNNVCFQHRLFDCPVCKAQLHPLSLNAGENPGGYNDRRNITNSSDQVILALHPRLKVDNDNTGEPGRNFVYQYDDSNKFHPVLGYNKPYSSHMNPRDVISDTISTSHRTDGGNMQGDRRFYQSENSFVPQRNVRNDGNYNDQFSREMTAAGDIPKQQNDNVQVGNKAFILDKFLQQCENSQ